MICKLLCFQLFQLGNAIKSAFVRQHSSAFMFIGVTADCEASATFTATPSISETDLLALCLAINQERPYEELELGRVKVRSKLLALRRRAIQQGNAPLLFVLQGTRRGHSKLPPLFQRYIRMNNSAVFCPQLLQDCIGHGIFLIHSQTNLAQRALPPHISIRWQLLQ